MKRSRRVWLKLMGSVAIGAASIGLTPGNARSHHRYARHGERRKPEQVYPSGGFGDAPRALARGEFSHGGG